MQRNFLKGENVGESEPKQPENNIQQRVLQGYKHLSEDLENKKLCKCVQMVRMYQAELQRNLDEGTNSLDNKNRSLQFALRKAYMEMIFENPRFARENYIDSLLWQKTVYMPFIEYRKLVDNCLKGGDLEQLEIVIVKLGLFIQESIGFYQNFTQRFISLQSFGGRDTFFDNFNLRGVEISKNKHLDNFRLQIAENVMINIGDLYRYKVTLCDVNKLKLGKLRFEDKKLEHLVAWRSAKESYEKAVLLGPENGFAYNQLGVMYSLSGRIIESIFYYYRAMTSKREFVTAKNNCILQINTEINKNKNSLKKNENILQILEFSMTIFTRTMFVFLERFNQTNIRFSYPAENLKGDRKLDFGYFTPLTIGIIWLVALLEKLDSERKDLVQAVRKVVGAEWFVLALDFTTKIIKNSKQKGKQNVGNLNCQNECLILLIDGWILPNGKRWNEMFYTEPKNEFGKINSKERMKNVAKARNGEGMTIGEVLLVDKLMKGIETISEAMKKEQKDLELETENKHFLFEEEEDKSEDDEVIVFSGKFRK
ncbi:hypothetical protein BB559_000738 [Furculomyces boomerangus]|uniref:Uncharacterized protein n=1 Tax=Furculomyces boomerangus TaxID=61424 RepID=A0A2T9Z4F6_9FUNG|nr:hypothetical protein BB559_000738 [Furculomyces boomerangus]